MIVRPRDPRETGRDYALRTLKENIICLGLEPGSMVSESELAAQLGISRTPVREALIELSKSGVVEIYPQKGSRIALIDYDRVDESRFTRLVLELAVVELACEMADEQDLCLLSHNLRLQDLCLEDERIPESASVALLRLDNEFHKMLFSFCGKERTWQMLDSFAIHFDRVRRLSLNAVKDNKTVSDHHAIYDAICRRDAPAARALMEKHLTRYRVEKDVIRRDYPQYFK